ncbi:hypothetical protein TIFTF001_004368 [Ficus carica]|uniref:F-box domain-containing protein n=1 Tax=Ficus carica TaxID=3494 RepID=A0AA88A4B2_FICCA|nr:hypothetical protein TIFTF001_004368 [Ficus carica]
MSTEEDCEFRRRDELAPEALELIFRKLSLDDKLLAILTVCKSWGRVVTKPYCWQEIEKVGRLIRYFHPKILHKLLQMLLTRCSGIREALKESMRLDRSIDPLNFRQGSQDDEALAEAATMPKLKHLEISYLRLRTKSVLKILSSCSELEFLDIQECWKVNLEQVLVKKLPSLKVLGPQKQKFFGITDYLAHPLFICEGFGYSDLDPSEDDMAAYYDSGSTWSP